MSYLQDGSLIVEYPFDMAVTMETSPHPLLSTEHQLQVKRKVILPGDALTHRLEWRYYLKRDRVDGSRSVSRVGRRMRVGSAYSNRHVRLGDVASSSLHDSNNNDLNSRGYEGKALLVGVIPFPSLQITLEFTLIYLYYSTMG